MKKELKFENVKFVMTRNELSYQDVLKDFINSRFIYIVTYNISKRDETLLRQLNKSPKNSIIQLYTNIPNRFHTYYSKHASATASDIINVYINKLNPEKFKNNFSSNFVFDNHSKIIMTNNIAYIGSANYSLESAGNLESGIILENSNDILRLKKLLDDVIGVSAESYYTYDIFPIIFLARELEEIKTILSENIWGVWETQGIERGKYYKRGNINFDINIVESIERFQVDLDRSIINLISEIETNFLKGERDNIEIGIIEELQDMNQLIKKYELNQNIIEFLEFNEENYINQLMQENSVYMTEEGIDEYIQNFTDQAFQNSTDLADNAENEFNELEVFLTESIEKLMGVVSRLRSIINSKIDNTEAYKNGDMFNKY